MTSNLVKALIATVFSTFPVFAACPQGEMVFPSEEQSYPTNPYIRDLWEKYIEAAAGMEGAELCQTQDGLATLEQVGFQCSSTIWYRHHFIVLAFSGGGVLTYYVTTEGDARLVSTTAPGEDDQSKELAQAYAEINSLCNIEYSGASGGGASVPTTWYVSPSQDNGGCIWGCVNGVVEIKEIKPK